MLSPRTSSKHARQLHKVFTARCSLRWTLCELRIELCESMQYWGGEISLEVKRSAAAHHTAAAK